MKKNYFTFLFIFSFIFHFVYGVEPKSKSWIKISGGYGYKLLQKSNFDKQLNTLNHFNITGPIRLAGMSLSFSNAWGIGNGKSHDQSISYFQVIPSTIKINDSINVDLRGFQIGAALFGNSFVLKKRKSYLIVMLGFNAGRLRVNSSEFLKDNSFFSPKLIVKPAIKFGNFWMDLTLDYEYDVSRKSWNDLKHKTPNDYPLAKFS